MCENDVEGLKEALTVLFVTHVERVESSVWLLHNTVYRVMLLILLMLKGSKEALTVLIVTHVTHVEGLKRSLNSFTHNFLNIQPIFNLKKVLES